MTKHQNCFSAPFQLDWIDKALFGQKISTEGYDAGGGERCLKCRNWGEKW